MHNFKRRGDPKWLPKIRGTNLFKRGFSTSPEFQNRQNIGLK